MPGWNRLVALPSSVSWAKTVCIYKIRNHGWKLINAFNRELLIRKKGYIVQLHSC